MYKPTLLKEDELSGAQNHYRTIASRQLETNETKSRKLGLYKKLTLCDRELDGLTTDVTAASSPYQKRAMHRYFEALEYLVQEKSLVDKAFKTLDTEVEHLKSQIVRVHNKRAQLEKKAVSDFAYAANLKHSNHVVTRLETCVNFARQSENRTKQSTIRLQQLIRDMCIDRIQFNKIWAQTVNGLYLSKKMLIAMTDQALIAFGKGIEIRDRFAAMTKNAAMLREEHISEMAGVLRSLDMDVISEQFMGNKANRIVMKDLDPKEVKRRNEFRVKYTKTREIYVDNMDQVKQIADASRLNELISKFEKSRQEYSSHFQYMNNLHRQVIRLNATLKMTEKHVGRTKLKSFAEKQKWSENAVQKRQANLQLMQTDNGQRVKKSKEIDESMKGYYNKLTDLIETLQCSDTLRLTLAGRCETERVHALNIQAFLAAMDKRLRQVMSFVYYLQSGPGDIVAGVDVINYHLNYEEMETVLHECAECAMVAETGGYDVQTPLDIATVRTNMMTRAMAPEVAYRMHNISQCDLPSSRALLAKSMKG